MTVVMKIFSGVMFPFPTVFHSTSSNQVSLICSSLQEMVGENELLLQGASGD